MIIPQMGPHAVMQLFMSMVHYWSNVKYLGFHTIYL